MEKRILFFLIFLITSYLYADEIILSADQWCPYNCDCEEDCPGFMIEIAEYAFEREGHTVTYITLPWARAIKYVREGKYTGIVGTGREETPDFIFPDIETAVADHTFYVKKGNTWRYSGFDSLEKVRLGAIINYSYGSLYNDYIKPNKKSTRVQLIGGKNALARNIKKLLNGRIDVLIEDKKVFQYHLYKTNTPDQFTDAGTAYIEKVYIAFSPKLEKSKLYAEILSKAMRELRETGELEKILKKYGIKDWRKHKVF